MTKEATQESVSEESTVEEKIVDEQVTTNPRMELMERMREKRMADMVSAEETGGDALPEGALPEAGHPPAQAEESPQSAPVYEREGKWYAKRKVNGMEEEVEFERMLADSQKNAAADARLEQVALERKRLAGIEAELMKEQDRLSQQTVQDTAAPGGPDKDMDELIKIRTEATIAYAEDDEDAEAFGRLRDAEEKIQALHAKRIQQPAIDKRAVVQEAVGVIKQQSWNQSYETANNWLYNQQEELDMKDEHLHELASTEAKRILQEKIVEGQSRDPSFSQYDVDPSEVYKDAVSKTKEWLNAKAGNATNQARIDRKRSSTGRSVSGSNARATIEDNTPRVKTQSERIADMRKARGLSG